MKRPIIILLLAFCLGAFFLNHPVWAETGVVLMVKGTVMIRSGGIETQAKTGLRLKGGDVVKSHDGTATILLDDGRVKVIHRDETFILENEGSSTNTTPLYARLMETLRETAHRGRGPTIKGRVRGERDIIPVFPHNSFLPPGKIYFQWIPAQGMDDVKIVIKSPAPAFKYSFSIQSGTTRAELPEEVTPLKRNIRYYWKVKAISKIQMEPYSSPLCWFGILGDEKYKEVMDGIKKIDSMEGLDQGSRDLLKANLFISYGLYHSAVDILSESLKSNPQLQGLKEVLRGVYIKMRRLDKAEAIK